MVRVILVLNGSEVEEGPMVKRLFGADSKKVEASTTQIIKNCFVFIEEKTNK